MTLDDEITNCIRQCLIDEFHPLKIIIFGSYANGTATPDSDVDILVIVSDDQSAGHEATVKARIAIRKGLKAIGKNIDFDLIFSRMSIFDRTKVMNGTIPFEAENNGIFIYG